jgi:hypothetical protein
VLQKKAMPLISNPTCETFYGKYKKANEVFCGASISGGNAMDITPGFGEGAPMAFEDEESGGRYSVECHNIVALCVEIK